MSDYKVPCGRTVGHGDRCSSGWLCDACSEIEKLRGVIRSSLRIDTLWLPGGEVAEEHADEARALHAMRDQMLSSVPAYIGEDLCRVEDSDGNNCPDKAEYTRLHNLKRVRLCGQCTKSFDEGAWQRREWPMVVDNG